MNKIVIIFLTLLLVNCANNKITLIKQNSSNNPVILKYNKEYNKVTRVKIPISIELENNSYYTQKYFVEVRYHYGNNKGINEILYKEVDKKLIKIKNNQKRIIKPNHDNKYVLYSSHKIDSFQSVQSNFKKEILKLTFKNKDTLHVGTVNQFKKTHKELFKKLTKNDSISIQFLDNDKFGKRITLPVNW